jgi:hypothetical protein
LGHCVSSLGAGIECDSQSEIFQTLDEVTFDLFRIKAIEVIRTEIPVVDSAFEQVESRRLPAFYHKGRWSRILIYMWSRKGWVRPNRLAFQAGSRELWDKNDCQLEVNGAGSAVSGVVIATDIALLLQTL